MGRRSYSGEKRRKELLRKAKREAKLERKREGRDEREAGAGPPIDWEAQVGGPGTPPAAGAAEPGQAREEPEEPGTGERG